MFMKHQLFLKKHLKLVKHELTIFDIYETSRTNPAKTSVVSGEYTVVEDVTAPEVKAVKALNANKFEIEFSEPVKLDAEADKSIEIKKGALTYKAIYAADDADFNTKRQAAQTANAYILTSSSTTLSNKVTVVIPEGTNYSNKLYGNNETTASLSVEIKNYKDKASLLGTAQTKSVTLSKGTSTPTEITGSAVAADKKSFTVKFDDTLTTVAEGDFVHSNLVVKNSEGVIIPQTEAGSPNYKASVTGNTVTVTAIADKYADSSYTVTFKKGAVKYLKVEERLTAYNFEDAQNKEFTTTVGTPSDANYKYAEFGGALTYVSDANLKATDNNNVITVNYGVKLDNSALNAANYKLDGKDLPAGTKLAFIGDKQKVQITFPKGSIKSTTDYKLTISTDVKTEKNQSIVSTLQKLDSVELKINLTDSVAPTLGSAQYLVTGTDAKETDTILVTASEKLATIDKTDFKVKVNGNEVAVKEVRNGDTGDDHFVIVLEKTVAVSQAATVELDANKVSKETIASKDEKNNALSGASVTTNGVTLDHKGNNVLTQAEQDAAAAKTVTDKIAALPAVGSLVYATDKTKVEQARTAFDALTSAQKALVTNKATLEAAEAKITALGKVDAATAAVTDGKYVLTGADVTWTLKTDGTTITNGANAPAKTSTAQTIVLVATATVNGQTATKEFTVTIAAQ